MNTTIYEPNNQRTYVKCDKGHETYINCPITIDKNCQIHGYELPDTFGEICRICINEQIYKWELYFVNLAKQASSMSKDPSTKVGSVIFDKNNRVISVGYNGFPKGIEDTEERLNNRELKYKLVVHAEQNAILFAQRDLSGCSVATWPFQPCSKCAGIIIQSGIKKVISPHPSDDVLSRWKEDLELSTELFKEAKVKLQLVRAV